MKKLFLLAVAALLTLAGCASPGRQYVEQNKPLAEQGKLPWSTYYEQAYTKWSESKVSGKGALLSRLNTMISAAKSYEAGQITADQFHHMRRQMEAAQHGDNAAAEQARIQAAIAASQRITQSTSQPLYQIVPPAPLPAQRSTYTNCRTIGDQMHCNSY